MSRRRGPGSGSIKNLPSGKWFVRATAPDGRQVSVGTYQTRALAEKALREWLSEADRGGHRDPQRGKVTLASYAEALLQQRADLTPRTRETYERSLRLYIVPGLGRLPLEKVTTVEIRRWLAGIASPTAARQAYSFLRAILNTAVEDGALARNPARIKGAGVARTQERPHLTPEQVAEIASHLPPHLQTLVAVSFWGHLRLGEALALQWGDVNLDAGTLHVRRAVVEVDGEQLEGEPKAHSRRVVTLAVEAVEALAAHRAAHPGLPAARVFTRLDGTPLRHHHVQHPWRTAREKAGLPEAHLHDLRHASLTLAAQAGATLRELMQRAGHKSSRAALIYQHVAANRDAEIAERMSEVAARGLSGTRKERDSQQGLPGTGSAPA